MIRFTIRDVLWLTVVVGLGAGWLVHVRAERQARIRDLDAMNAELDKQEARSVRLLAKFEELRKIAIERWPDEAARLPKGFPDEN